MMAHSLQHPYPLNATKHWMWKIREQLFGLNSTSGQSTEQHNNRPNPVALDSHDLMTMMIDFSERINDWPVVIYLRTKQARLLHHKDLVNENKAALARAYHQQGMLVEARHLQSCLVVDDPQLKQDYCQLQREMAAQPFASADLQNSSMIITPLTAKDLNAFALAFSDLKIAKLCGLPVFNPDQLWLDWLAKCQAEPNKYIFALNHRTWGLIGSVSLQIYDGVGFFYLWLGVDFQGEGDGPQALDLLLHFASMLLGMSTCYGKVHHQSVRTQKAMQKTGFLRLPFVRVALHENETLYYWGNDKSDPLKFVELSQLFIARGEASQSTPNA